MNDVLIISLFDTHFDGIPMVIQARSAHYLELVTTHSIYNQWKSRGIGNVWDKSVLTDKISFWSKLTVVIYGAKT